jgi:hypothetical protein
MFFMHRIHAWLPQLLWTSRRLPPDLPEKRYLLGHSIGS